MANDTDKQLVKILAVDDSRLMRKAVTRILKGLNEVVEAEDGEQAWDILQQDEQIRIVCCDLSMPVMDGFGFLQRVRESEDERIRDMPVIIVTGQEDSEENRNRIFEAGASDFVSKPFDSAQLRASIKTHTKLERTTSELKKKESEFEDSVAIDALTGLGTLAFFRKSAEQLISLARRNQLSLIVIRFELDDARELFMQLGMDSSNALIRKIGELLSKSIRQEDMLCRIGLSGFAALLRSDDLQVAVNIAERTRGMIAHLKLQVADNERGLGMSAGVAKISIEESTTVDHLMDAAAEQLQRAQKAGGNQLAYDKASLETKPAEPLELQQALDLLAAGEVRRVAAQINTLIRKIAPLLGLYAKVNAKGAKQLIEKLQAVIKP